MAASAGPVRALIDTSLSFSSPPFSTLLDGRLLKALADQGFTHPTLVQAKAIPLLLDGKDVLAKARTGSGKTAAYAVPGVQKVLEAKKNIAPTDPSYQSTRVLILVPTRELALQVSKFLSVLAKYCDSEVSAVNVAAGGSAVQRVLLNDRPDIVIATPSKALALLQAKTLDLTYLSLLCIDEADLLLSYGHSADVQRLVDPSSGFIPKLGVQAILLSATLTSDVDALKGFILRNPAILRLSEPSSSSNLTQYSITTSEQDKFLMIYVLLKLKLIKGKALLFVNTVERGYKLRLFLEQFGIRSCVVNEGLPLNSRYHIVEEFNKGVYDYIIATDEADLGGEDDESESEGESEAEEEKAEDKGDEVAEAKKLISTPAEAGPSSLKRAASPTTQKPSKKARKADASFGVSRGIDFVAVACVVNFDLPTTVHAYTHRVGRTARAGQTGLALSFVVPADKWGKDKVVSLDTARKDERVFARIKKHAEGDIKEWDWGGRRGEIEGFRYRMEDALRSVTGKRVQEARREEVRREMLNSDKLKAHFAANPLDLSFLRHDTPLHPTRVQPHMKHVPTYLMPRIAALPRDDVPEGEVPFRRPGGRGRGSARGRGGSRGGSRGGKRSDPLKKFK